MARKNEVVHAMRKEFIEDLIELLRKEPQLDSMAKIYQEIADEYLFCSVNTVRRALLPYEYPTNQKRVFPTNQLSFNLK